jgi:lipoprotein signal peptidase
MSASRGKKWNAGSLSLFVSAAVLFAMDRGLKFGVMGTAVGSADDAIRFAIFKNPGIAFSLPLSSFIFWPAAAVIFMVLAWSFGLSLVNGDRMRAGIFFLILLGAASNLVDRAFYGATIDYLIFFNRSAVNIADGMIIAGLLALIFDRSKDELASPADTVAAS